MLPAKIAKFSEEDRAADARETWYGSRFKPIAEYRQPKLALEQLREKYQRNYVLVFETQSPLPVGQSPTTATTQVNNLQEWSERKGALITIRSCYIKIPNAAGVQMPTVVPIDLFCTFDQDNMFQYDYAQSKWLNTGYFASLPHRVTYAGVVPPISNATSAIYQAQSDDLNKVYVPSPFSSITVQLRDPFNNGDASVSLDNRTQLAAGYFKLVMDVQFIE